MIQYWINPYISFIESRLVADFTQRAVFHRLTGKIFEPTDKVRSLLQVSKLGNPISLNEADLPHLGAVGAELTQLLSNKFLIPEHFDPLAPLIDHIVTHPMQNPALLYRSRTGEWILVRTSMDQTVYSRKRDELPVIIEERLSSLAAEIFLMADGTKKLSEIFGKLRGTNDAAILQDSEFRAEIDFLTTQERQLIKFTSRVEDLSDPFSSVNIVPRNLYHSQRWDETRRSSETNSIIDFHLQGIEDAAWEFDLIEPTINHGFRFPHEALGGLDYGTRFCLATLHPDVVPLWRSNPQLEVLEVGGGTGTFARSFIKQANSLGASPPNISNVNYHILDLSPALIENQRKNLSQILTEDRYFQQDATEFDLPHAFDLIIANEVIADFPVGHVELNNNAEKKNCDPTSDDAQKWKGDGAHYLYKYDLSDKDAPRSFLVNVGAFRFIECAWKHLNPGGTLIVSEYGTQQRFPARAFHLNHDEFSIHFGHLATCATRIGFSCRLLTLKDFLKFDDEVLVLNGREEHILCLNHILKSYGLSLPFAVISKSDFENQCQGIADEIELNGFSFSPLRKRYHFGPNIEDFLVLIMNKPR